MKKFGLIGGIGPESTIEYYKLIIQRFRELTDGSTYPDFLIENIDMLKLLNYISNKNYNELTGFLKDRISVLEKANVDFGAMASNTPHIVFDDLAKQVTIPLISIVEETCKETMSNKLNTVGLLGTLSTMTNGFYQKTGEKHGIKIVTPSENQMLYVHDKYINELIYRDIQPVTKNEFINIVNQLYEKYAIEGLILGGTELPLILSQNDFKHIQIMDTTKIHVDSIVKMMISK